VLASAAASAAAVIVLVSVAVPDPGTSTTVALGPLWAAAMVALALLAHLAQRRVADARRARVVIAVLAGAAAGLAILPLLAGLHGTAQPPYTIARGDMTFRTEYVTRFASSWHLQDYTLQGLHAFYPPAWFWVAGRAAHVLGVVPWRIVAPFTIATIGFAALVAYALWRMVLSPAGALSATVGSLLVLPAQVGALMPGLQHTTTAWYSSYSCFVAVTGVAWLAATLGAVRGEREGGGGSRRRLALLAVVGAALALTYYLLVVILVVVLVVLAAIGRTGRREALLRVAAVGGGMALLTAVFWVPLASALIHGASSQGHFVSPEFYEVYAGIGQSPALTVLAVVAIALLVLTRASLASRAVAGVLAGTVLWQILSVVTLELFHNQLQPHRAVAMMWAAYGAAVPVALESRPSFTRPLRVAAVTLAVASVVVLGGQQGRDLVSGPITAAAHTPVNLAGPAEISHFITQTTGRRPSQLTIVTGNHTLMATRPYWGFLPLRARYAHPEARMRERVGVLQRAAACLDAACTARVLEGSRFGRIDALVLDRTPVGWKVDTDEDAFPRPLPVTVAFSRGSFDPSVWASRQVGRYTVFVLRQ
jgi:galactan 5-O-arabinofuranosyltransferase